MGRQCRFCGTPLPAQVGRGRRRVWCQDACRKRYEANGGKPLATDLLTGAPAPIEAQGVADVLAELAPTLVVPHGLQAGAPPTLMPWMLEFLRGAFARHVREAALSVARKNAKSSLVALALLAWLAAPKALHRPPAWRAAVASETGALAGELRDLLAAFLAASGIAHKVRRSPSPGAIEVGDASVTFANASSATGLALGADLAIVDEAGVLGEGKRNLWDSMVSSTSARGGRFLALGAQYEGPMFHELIARADDPAVHVAHYAAPADCALDDEAAWRLANPALGVVKARGYMVDMARRAAATPANESGFRGHDLNSPVAAEREQIVSLRDWRACCEGELPPRDGPAFVGLDAGGSASMTAAAAWWPATGRFECWAALPASPPLAERERADGVGKGDYAAMRARGELTTYPGRTTPLGAFLGDVGARLAGCRVACVGADRYRQADVVQAVQSAGVRWPMGKASWRGMGAGSRADGSHDVRAFQRAVLGGRLVAAPSRLMTMAVAESEVRYDAAGNPALGKARSRSRIDALSAACIAVGLGTLWRPNAVRWHFPNDG